MVSKHDSSRVAALVREGVLPSRKTAQQVDTFGAAQRIANGVKQRALQDYAAMTAPPSESYTQFISEFGPLTTPEEEFDFPSAKRDVNLEMEGWIEEEIHNSRLPDQYPVEVLANAFANANAFQDESIDFSEKSWNSVLYDMAFYAMKADVYALLKEMGWDERTGFPYEVK